MAKLSRKLNNAVLAILIALCGIGLLSMSKAEAAGANEWYLASESSATTVTSNMVVSSGPTLLDAISLSSSTAASGYVIIRDSNPTSNSVVTLIFFSSDTAVSGQTASLGAYRTFNPPLRFSRGLAAEATSCPSGSSLCYSVHFRRISDIAR